MIRLTDWFPPARTPDLIGYYDTQVNFEPPMVLFWDGFRWRASAPAPADVALPESSEQSVQRMWDLIQQWHVATTMEEARTAKRGIDAVLRAALSRQGASKDANKKP